MGSGITLRGQRRCRELGNCASVPGFPLAFNHRGERVTFLNAERCGTLGRPNYETKAARASLLRADHAKSA
jgi:hypothetical protein